MMMKRILFYSENFCGDKSPGGLEVATYRIAMALKDSNRWEVFNAYRNRYDIEDSYPYSDTIKLHRSGPAFENDLNEFIKKNRIDVVVNMTRFFRHKYIRNAVKASKRDVKLLFMLHFAPGSEKKKPTFTSGLHLLRLNPYNPLYWIRASIYPLLKYRRNRSWDKVYRSTYQDSDKIILLSDGYRDDYCRVGHFDDQSKFLAIPNIFETDSKVNEENGLQPKKKRILILSRLDEIQKRVSLALEVWSKVQDDPDLQDWHLDIVGWGHNADIVKRLIKKLGLKRVTLHGWQPREQYLKDSSILLSTAEYEGLPLSILEAQAYGVVPVAFDSYASLRDVVTDEEDGIVISDFGDTKSMAERLAALMKDDERLHRLSEKGREASRRFSFERIGAMWLEMLENL